MLRLKKYNSEKLDSKNFWGEVAKNTKISLFGVRFTGTFRIQKKILIRFDPSNSWALRKDDVTSLLDWGRRLEKSIEDFFVFSLDWALWRLVSFSLIQGQEVCYKICYQAKVN